MTERFMTAIGNFQRRFPDQKRLMLNTFAVIATIPSGRPTHGPTPDPTPTSGAKKGRMT